MPQEGDNAISEVAVWVARLEAHRFENQHPPLGRKTAVTTTIMGGQNINSVPDLASFTVDFRTLPNDDHEGIVDCLRKLFGNEAEVRVVTDFPGFSTNPVEPAIAPIFAILEERLGSRPRPIGAPYLTDASALVPGFQNAPTLVIGPSSLPGFSRSPGTSAL